MKRFRPPSQDNSARMTDFPPLKSVTGYAKVQQTIKEIQKEITMINHY